MNLKKKNPTKNQNKKQTQPTNQKRPLCRLKACITRVQNYPFLILIEIPTRGIKTLRLFWVSILGISYGSQVHHSHNSLATHYPIATARKVKHVGIIKDLKKSTPQNL